MKADEFEKIVRQSKFKLLPKQFTPDGNVLLAERFKPLPVAHYETLWAWERDDCDFANFVRNNAFWGGHIIAQETRINDAMEAAQQWMKDGKVGGLYN